MSDWEVQRKDRSSGWIRYEIVEIATGVRIAELDDQLNHAAREHASLIVRAVACQERLLEILRWGTLIAAGDVSDANVREWIADANAAIQAARGETGL